MRRTGRIYRGVAQVMALVMALSPVIVRADTMADFGREGQAYGKHIAPSAGSIGHVSGGTLTMPYADNASIELNKLFPGPGEGETADDYFPHSGDVDALESLSDSDSGMLDIGGAMNSSLGADANSDDPSIQGMAYEVIRQAEDRSRPDFENDPVLGMSDDLFYNIDNYGDAFPACSDASGNGYDPNSAVYNQCDRLSATSLSGTINHQYNSGVLKHYAGPINLNPCEGGESCFKLWIGQVGNNYWEGSCTIYESATEVLIDNPDAITKATLEYAKWDDYMQVWVGPADNEVKVWSGPHGDAFPPETEGKCELKTSWERDLSTDVTEYFKNVQPGEVVRFHIRVSVSGEGEGYGRIKIDYDPSKVVSGDNWDPTSEIDNALKTADQFGDTSLTCVDQPPSVGGCLSGQAVQVCESDFAPSPLPGISPLCKKVEWKANKDSYIGREHAWCEDYEANPSCGFVATQCADKNDDGSCKRYVDTYNCNSSSSSPACDLSTTLPEAFTACEQETTVTPVVENKKIHNYEVCEQTNILTGCEVEREVTVKDHHQQWNIARTCFDEEQLRYTPEHAGTMISGGASLNVTTAQNTSASIVESPNASNDWTTTVLLKGNKAPARETQATLSEVNYECATGSLSGTTCYSTNEAGEPVTSPATPVTNYYCATGWDKVDDGTCERWVEKCLDPASLNASVTFEGRYLEQTVNHFPDDEGVARCMMQSDNFTAVQWQCLDETPRTVAGEVIGSSRVSLLEGLYPNVMNNPEHLTSASTTDGRGSFCWRGRATYNPETGQSEFNVGSGSSWVDPEGNVHGIDNTLENTVTNTCRPLEEDPQCEFVREECTEGAEGHDDYCYVSNLVYDCGENVEVNNLTVNTTYTCPGETRCMGSDCLDLSKGQSQDFGKAASLLHAAEFMGDDMVCEGVDEDGHLEGDTNVVCKVFGGEAGECKKAVGGTVDCCEKPSNVSMQDYLTMVMSVPKLDAAIMGIEDKSLLSGAKSAYQVVREPMVSTFKEVTQPFTSYFDGISSQVDTLTSAVEDQAIKLVEGIKKKIAEMASKAMGNAATGGGVGAGGTVTAGAQEESAKSFTQTVLGDTGASVFSGLMAAYTAYVVTMLIIQTIYACEEEEFAMNAKRELKSCAYVGSYCKSEILGACIEKRESYCCFNSPLSRIIQEQARAQLGESWGSAKNPQCGGLTIDQIGALDWSSMDLGEWTAMLEVNGMYPDANNMNMEELTGTGSTLNLRLEDADAADNSPERLNAEERSMQRVQGIDTNAIMRGAEQTIGSSAVR